MSALVDLELDAGDYCENCWDDNPAVRFCEDVGRHLCTDCAPEEGP